MNFVRIMKFRQWFMGFTLVCLCSTTVHAQISQQTTTDPQDSQQQPTIQEFFTVNEDSLETLDSDTQSRHTNVLAMAPMFTPDQFIQAAKTFVVNLLRWTLHNEVLPEPTEKYMRKLHFGRWINDPNDDTCMNTRARVLVRDNVGNLTYRTVRNCVVDTGLWNDPYTGTQVSTSKEIQIDHMVPLKNAYLSGAWQWDYKTRCLYANYMGFKNHLVSSGAHENMSKGDKAPDKYLPPDLNFRCQYVRNWLAVKLIWGLNMTPSEVYAINQVVNNYGCNRNDFKFTQKDLNDQRQNIQDNIEFCMINKR